MAPSRAAEDMKYDEAAGRLGLTYGLLPAELHGQVRSLLVHPRLNRLVQKRRDTVFQQFAITSLQKLVAGLHSELRVLVRSFGGLLHLLSHDMEASCTVQHLFV